MPKITRISAGQGGSSHSSSTNAQRTANQELPAKKSAASSAVKKSPKKTKTKKSCRFCQAKPVKVITWPFRQLARPFIALGRYIKDSWQELRQVRWPSRKATWKMTGAILVYTALLLAFIVALDTFFTFVFNQLFKK